jgi:exodeoxyribonuclease III
MAAGSNLHAGCRAACLPAGQALAHSNDGAPCMKVATYNVNGIKARLPRLLEWLAEARPDVVCLQETKTGDATFPAEPIRAAGYELVWHGQPRHHGVAVLSREGLPVEVRRGIPGDDADGQARYLEVDVGSLRVASVYLPNGNPVPSDNFDYKLRWFARFNQHARTLIASGRPTLLCGDFNVVPANIDIYNAGAWRFDAVLQPETRNAYQALLAQGWIDSARYLRPEARGPLYTFWVNEAAYRRNAGFRMDFLLLSPDLRNRLTACEVDSVHRGRERPSDHAPVWVMLS